MIIELPLPHMFPLLQLAYYKIYRCCDRGCKKDRRRSKMILQKDYEDIYIGCEFVFDYRLAQIVAFVQVTFMYNIGLPILFFISILNFALMYWIDKWLLLRFHCRPKNFDETTINFALNHIKVAFFLHAIVGFAMLQNDGILKTEFPEALINFSGHTAKKEQELETWSQWYEGLQGHTTFFQYYMIIILVFLVFF